MSELHENIDPTEYQKSVSSDYKDLEQLEEIFNYRESCEMELQQIVYENSCDEEKALIDYTNAITGFSRYEFVEFIEKVNQNKERYTLDNEVIERNEREKKKYLNDEFAKIVQEITKSDIGRDYLKNQSPEKLINLFDVSKDDKFISDSHVINLGVYRETYGLKRRKLIKALVTYIALKELLSNAPSITDTKIKEKDNPHKDKSLIDVLKDPAHFDRIIKFLISKRLIDSKSNKFLKRKSTLTTMTGIMEFLADKRLLKEDLSQELAAAVLLNTFDFKVTQYNYTERSLTPLEETQLSKELNFK